MKKTRIRILLSGAFGVVILSGCATYERPVAAIAESSYTKLQENEKLLLPAGLSSLSLEEAQRLALKNNPNFKSKQFVVNSARARYYQAYSAYAPTLNAGMSVQQRFGRLYSGRVDEYNRQQENYTPSVYGQWLIFDGLSREMNVLATQQGMLSSEALQNDSERLLIRAVAYSYNDILLAEAQERIARADYEYSQILCQDAQRKFDAGMAPQTDVLNFQVNVQAAQRNLNTARYNLAANKYVLAGYLGLTTGSLPPELTFGKLEMPSREFLLSPELYLDTALANRPDLKAYRNIFKESKYAYWGTWGRFAPTITANYQLEYNQNRTIYGGESTRSERSGNGGLGYGVEASWNLFNGGDDYFAMKQAVAKMAENDYLLAEKWINIITEVRTAYENYQICFEQARLSESIYKLSMETRNKVENEYKTGVVDVTRMNLAQKDLVNSENELAQAIVNLANAKAQLDAAVGQNQLPAEAQEEIQTKGK